MIFFKMETYLRYANFVKVNVTGIMQEEPVTDETLEIDVTEKEPEVLKRKKTIKSFMDSIKTNLIEMFKEEGDEEL